MEGPKRFLFFNLCFYIVEAHAGAEKVFYLFIYLNYFIYVFFFILFYFFIFFLICFCKNHEICAVERNKINSLFIFKS